MNEDLPEYLYKYTTLDNLFNILTAKKLKFSSPIDFNDPFDCKLYDKYEIKIKELEDFFVSLNPTIFKNRFEGPNKDQEVFLAKFHFMEALQNSVNKIGVSCFSSDENNLLLWAHYADKHKGVCIKFKTSELQKVFQSIRYISYSEIFPEVNPLKDFQGALNIAPLHKSAHWSYEKEIRIITGEFGYFDFPPNAIEQIMFGVKFDQENMTEDKREIIRNFKKIGNNKIKCYLTNQHREAYKVIRSAEWCF